MPPPSTPFPSYQNKTQQRQIYNTIAAVARGTNINAGGGGTVTSVGLSMPVEFNVANSPVTDSGTLTVTMADESANTIWAGPTTGVSASPTFRAMVAADIPATTVVPGTYVAATITVDAAGRLTSASTASTTGSGTVTSVGLSMPSIFSVAGSPITSSGTITASLVSENANTVFAGPTSGASASPTFRALVTADLPANDGGLIARRVFTTTGSSTYTASTGTNWIIVEAQGAGGGGGSGAASPGAGKVTLGGSGSAGAYLSVALTANFNGGTIVVGAKGTGGASGGSNTGTAGGASSFTLTTGTTYSAGGGNGDGTVVAVTPPYITGAVNGSATSGATPDTSIPGSAPMVGISANVASTASGQGGRSFYSTGGWPAQGFSANSTVVGNDATGYGGGGTGAVISGTGATKKGGDGSNGIVIIWEFR